MSVRCAVDEKQAGKRHCAFPLECPKNQYNFLVKMKFFGLIFNVTKVSSYLKQWKIGEWLQHIWDRPARDSILR
jgi:hypothetical protein